MTEAQARAVLRPMTDADIREARACAARICESARRTADHVRATRRRRKSATSESKWLRGDGDMRDVGGEAVAV